MTSSQQSNCAMTRWHLPHSWFSRRLGWLACEGRA